MSISTTIERLRKRANERGSALLVSLMVMVGLSLLGLAFVALSETENAISLNERNHAQTVAVAETGARLVVQWFQDPSSMLSSQLMPVNEQALRKLRAVTASPVTTGYYRPTGNLCDTPFGPNVADLFMGDEDHPDILINATTIAACTTNAHTAPTWLDALNTKLFGTTANGEITELAIFAPPVVGATHMQSSTYGSYVGGQRFGIATVKATAQKKNPAGNVIAQAVVRLVLGPFPLPGPSGAIQAIGHIGNNGNFKVHWGPVESENDIALTKDPIDYTSIPWFNAWDPAHIERGYDSSTIWQPSAYYIADTFPLGSVVRPTPAAVTANSALANHEYVATPHTGAGTPPLRLQAGTGEPAWPAGNGASVTDGSGPGQIDWVERPRSMYKIYSSDGTVPAAEYDGTNMESHNWFAEILSKPVDDPWFQMRSWGTVAGSRASGGSTTVPHPYPYARSPVPTSWDGSNWFQRQTFNGYPDYKRVEVPRFQYEVWKAAALAGRGQPGVHYLQWNGADFTDGVNHNSMTSWLATGNGFYFFDTLNGQDPQNGGTGTLTTGGTPCGFKGFAYLNATQIDPGGGCAGTNGYYPQPGEPFRDIGYRQVVEVTASGHGRGDWAKDAAGNYITIGAFDGKFSYQDLDWSNSGARAGIGLPEPGVSPGKNNMFDVCVQNRTFIRDSDATNTQIHEWVPIEYFPGCKPGNNSTLATCNCSEPHEPYFNLRYNDPDAALSNVGNGTLVPTTLGWSDPATNVGRPKKTSDDLPSGSLGTCSAADVASITGQTNCTTNAYDYLGGMAKLQIGVQGVIYIEGSYNGTGNTQFFGSMVCGIDSDPNGTARIWYDERLVKGGWPPAGITFPRVMISSEQIQ
jgi:hypothetical protein